MIRTTCITLGFIGVFISAGCGDSTSTNGITQWMGSALHMRVIGNVHGEMIDINVSGQDAANAANLWCEREYQVPNDANGMPDYTKGHNAEVRFKTPATIVGEMRLLDIGLKRHNSQVDAAGTVVNVIPRDDTMPPCSLNNCPKGGPMWLSLTWRKPSDNSILYKQAAVSGSWTLGEYVGTPDSMGLLIPPNSGAVGGFATGQWSPTESLSLSVSANCTINKIDNSY